MSDAFKEILELALEKARRSLSTSELAKVTMMDWSTAKKKLLEMEKEGIVYSKTFTHKVSWSITPFK